MSRRLSIVVYILTFALLALFLIYPILNTVKAAFFTADGSRFTFEYFFEIFRNRNYLEGLGNAMRMAIFSTFGCLLISLPLAYASTRFEFPGKALLSSLILIPLILPPFVGAIGVKKILGKQGSLNSLLDNLGIINSPIDWLGAGQLTGVVIMIVLHLYPILYLNISAALSNLDPALEEAAENLGCSPWKRFWTITLPLTLPGIFAGSTIVFIWSFTELGVPLIFDYNRVTPVQIFDGIKDLSGNPMPYALVVVVLLSTLLLFAVSKHFFGSSNYSGSGRAGMASHCKTLQPWKAAGITLAFCTITFLAILPHIGVILLSFSKDWYGTVLPLIPEGFTLGHYDDALSHDLTVGSIGNSLLYASLATLVDVILGVAIAYIVVRTTLPGRQLLDSLAMLPLAVPGLVLAFGYLAMSREGRSFDFLVYPDAAMQGVQALQGESGIIANIISLPKRIMGTVFGWIIKDGNPVILLVIAYAIRRLPYVVRSAVAGLQQTNVSLEEAAQNLGCTAFGALRKITIPIIVANLIAGALLAFAFAMLEVSDSLILAERAEHYPITKAIYSLFSSLGNGPYLASALGVWSMLFLGTTIIGAGLILGKKLGALFRV